jgi:hypothetical protein
MFRKFRIPLALCVLYMSVAVSAQVPGANDPDAKELAAYRLTIPTLDKVMQATKLMVEAAKSDPRIAKRAALNAEIKKLEDKDELSDAEQARLEQLQAEAERAEESLFSGADSKTLSDMAAAMQREPLFAKGLAAAGLSAREYSKFLLAYFQAGMVAGMMQQGLIKEVPKDLAASMNMENVKFVQEHQAELEAFGKQMEALNTP